MELNKVEEGIVPIYKNTKGEKYISARELHEKLGNKRKFADWIKQRIEHFKFLENQDFFTFHNFVKRGENNNLGTKITEYYITIDMAKELCMVENNEIGRVIRKYFIEVEKRYRNIIESPTNIFDFMRLALDEIEKNEKQINNVKQIAMDNKSEIEKLKSVIDVKIQKNYCLASDIAEQLNLYSENNLPHSSLVAAIARQLGYKTSYKHYFEDENIAIITDISKGKEFWQVYYKPKAVKEIIEWFKQNKSEIEYKIIYERNTKNGQKGEVREIGYKIEDVCYKVNN